MHLSYNSKTEYENQGFSDKAFDLMLVCKLLTK